MKKVTFSVGIPDLSFTKNDVEAMQVTSEMKIDPSEAGRSCVQKDLELS